MTSDSEAAAQLNPVIHPIQRLRICALLEPVTEEEFAVLRDLLDVSDSALSKQLSALTTAGFVTQRRAASMGRSRVWVQLTPSGIRAFRSHIRALRDLTA
ncbi:transcriptional regulator [Agrococcus casei]|uniref:Transcriptional regulator n=1 Tax=Agrococcus casei LMG 22410 TaxID=1255656 RepID=A0A1R4F623_9MICO|nr:transcriptional regulator [Agrococcus casei]SJM51283.1 Transcriptional regulator [Agrococcus casei LMG 22410]